MYWHLGFDIMVSVANVHWPVLITGTLHERLHRRACKAVQHRALLSTHCS